MESDTEVTVVNDERGLFVQISDLSGQVIVVDDVEWNLFMDRVLVADRKLNNKLVR